MEPKHVHHSYIWLGSITTILSVLFFGAIAFFPLVAGLVSDGDLPSATHAACVLSEHGLTVAAGDHAFSVRTDGRTEETDWLAANRNGMYRVALIRAEGSTLHLSMTLI